MSDPVRVLFLEDDVVTREVTVAELRASIPEVVVDALDGPQQYKTKLATADYDAVITDFQLNSGTGIDILRYVRRNFPDLPVIMYTGSGSEEIAVNAMKAGLSDYVLKRDGSSRLVTSVNAAVAAARAREELEREKARYQVLFNSVPIGLYRCDSTGRYVQANQAMAELYGYDDSVSFLKRGFSIGHDLTVALELEDLIRDHELSVSRPDKKRMWLRHQVQVVKNARGEVLHYEGAAQDISDRKLAEEKQEGLVEALRRIASAANQLGACDDLDSLYRMAVEFGHEFLGLERCAIFVEDGQVMRGTYGVSETGEVSEIKEVYFLKPEGTTERFGLSPDEDTHWMFIRNPVLGWDSKFSTRHEKKWLAVTSITNLRAGDRSKGVFLNDAVSGKDVDRTQQTILSIFCSLLGDILELKETADALIQSEELFRTLKENSPVGIWQLTPDGLTTYMNPVMCEMLEVDHVSELHGQRYHSFFTEKGSARLIDRMTSESGARELEIVGKRGGRKTVVTAGAPFFGPDGALHSMIRIFVDLTEQTELERQLKNVVNSVPVVLYCLDPQGNVTLSEGKGLAGLGLEPGEVVGQNILEMYAEYPEVKRQFELALQGKELTFTSEVAGINWEGRYVPVLDSEGQLQSLIGVALDVTEQCRLEREVLEISSREQRRIGNDLHDNLGQQLTGISFLAKALEQRLAEQRLPEAESAQRINLLVNQTIDQTRQLARELIPVHLESTGLTDALKDLCRNVESLFDTKCHYQVDTDTSSLDHGVSSHLFRIAQEAIHNAVRHGEAENIWIGLEKVNGLLTLTIDDDGRGFSGTTGNEGLGLNIMRYRARMIHASIEFVDRPEGGVRVACSLRTGSPA